MTTKLERTKELRKRINKLKKFQGGFDPETNDDATFDKLLNEVVEESYNLGKKSIKEFKNDKKRI